MKSALRPLELVAAAALVLACCSCDRPSTGPAVPPAAPRSMSSETEAPVPGPRAALHADYVAVASRLADPMMERTDEPPWRKDLTQIIAEGQVKVLAYREVAARTPDRTLAFVAAEGADSGSALLQAHQAMSMLRQDEGLGQLLLMGAGLWLGEPGMVLSGAQGVLAADGAHAQQKTAWTSAFVRSRAAQLMLPTLAERCAWRAPVEPAALRIDVDESFAGSADHDLLALTNTAGRALHNCTVLVELRGAAGDVAQNVHFVRVWEPGSERYARYGIGVDTPRGPVGRQTVYGIQEVRVSMWSDECRAGPLVCTYPGPERDRDIAAVLESNMKVAATYVPHPLFGGGRSLDLRLDGVATLPEHTVTLHFRRGREVKTKQWQQKPWKRGEKRRFQSGPGLLAWDPEQVDVEIAFPDSQYVWWHTVSIDNPGPGAR